MEKGAAPPKYFEREIVGAGKLSPYDRHRELRKTGDFGRKSWKKSRSSRSSIRATCSIPMAHPSALPSWTQRQQRFTGTADYAWHSWNFHYSINFNNLSSPERSVNTSSKAMASQPLLALSWSQSRRLTAPISEFSRHLCRKLN
jgi:hypothetical protein